MYRKRNRRDDSIEKMIKQLFGSRWPIYRKKHRFKPRRKPTRQWRSFPDFKRRQQYKAYLASIGRRL